MSKESQDIKYPGIPEAMDGNTAVIMCERESSDAAGAAAAVSTICSAIR